MDALDRNQREVICPAFCSMTAEIAARDLFADVDAATMNLDPEDVAAGSSRTRRSSPSISLGGPRH
jgi:hypothetical protein